MNLYLDPRRSRFLDRFPVAFRSEVANAFLRCYNANKNASDADLCRAVWIGFHDRSADEIVTLLTRCDREARSVALDYAAWVRAWAQLPTQQRAGLKRGGVHA